MMSQFDIRITVRETNTFISHILWYKLIVWYTVGKTSNCCLVMAQLITQGKKRGIHLFFVQIRDLKTHRHMPGIDILVHCKILLYYTEIFFKFFYLDLMIHLMSRVCWKTSSLDYIRCVYQCVCGGGGVFSFYVRCVYQYRGGGCLVFLFKRKTWRFYPAMYLEVNFIFRILLGRDRVKIHMKKKYQIHLLPHWSWFNFVYRSRVGGYWPQIWVQFQR